MSRIMIVDDAVVIREKLKILLTKAGHEVVAEAGNGLQAALLYSRLRPDIVTMDITMPGVDGIEGIRKIRTSDPAAKIIVISALGQKAIIVEALEAGASGFILKPFDIGKVLAVIESVGDRLKSELSALKAEKIKMDNEFATMTKKMT